MAMPILSETLSSVDLELREALESLDRYCGHLRGLSVAIKALLPGNWETHPVLMVPNGQAVAERDRYELRDSLIAARSLAEMVDEIGSLLQDVTYGCVERAQHKLGLSEGGVARG